MSESFETLLPHQAQLVERLLARPPVRVALVAPPGTGKTTAVMAAIAQLRQLEPSSTVLVVAPGAIGSYCASLLERRQIPVRVQRLKGSDLRLHEKGTSVLEPGVYIVSAELVRQSWARDVLTSVPWSLAFVDEATNFGPSLTEVVRLLAAGPSERVCTASGRGWANEPPIPELLVWSTDPTPGRIRRLTSVHYHRTPEELRVRERLSLIEEEFGAEPLIRASLNAAWRSSASAFEFVVARQGEAVRALGARTGDVEPRSFWRDRDGAHAALQALMHEIGAVRSDPKLEAFLAHVVASDPAKAAVFTAMRQSAIYLQAGLDSREIASSVIDGARAPDDRTPPEEARVVIITDAVLPAVELPQGFEGLSYDLPSDPRRMEARWSALRNAKDEAVMAVMIDDTMSDASEQDLLHKHALIESVLGDVPDPDMRN